MPQMRKYWESKMTQIMMATVPHVTSGSGLRKFQADGFLFDRVYKLKHLKATGITIMTAPCTDVLPSSTSIFIFDK